MEYAYIRVSSKEQNEDRQLIAMLDRGIPKSRIFVEKLSGKDIKRPALNELINKIQKGDVVVVESVSRFARNTQDFLLLLTKLESKDVEFISLKEQMDTATPAGRFMRTVFAATAELEREYLLQRQAEGVDAAKKRGVVFGRPKKEPKNFEEIVIQWQNKKIDFKEALRKTGLKSSTFYSRLREMRRMYQK